MSRARRQRGDEREAQARCDERQDRVGGARADEARRPDAVGGEGLELQVARAEVARVRDEGLDGELAECRLPAARQAVARGEHHERPERADSPRRELGRHDLEVVDVDVGLAAEQEPEIGVADVVEIDLHARVGALEAAQPGRQHRPQHLRGGAHADAPAQLAAEICPRTTGSFSMKGATYSKSCAPAGVRVRRSFPVRSKRRTPSSASSFLTCW